MSAIAAKWYIQDAERRSLDRKIEDASQQYRRDGREDSFAKVCGLIAQRDTPAPKESDAR